MANANEKQEPIRTCIATGKKLPKRELLRVVSKDGGPVEYDVTGKKAGRGANISMEPEALELALKKHSFDRAFKRKITDEEVNYLRGTFLEAIEEKKFRGSTNKKVTLRVKKEDLDNLS